MKISELILILLKKQGMCGDVEVGVTWEGIYREIDEDNVYCSKPAVFMRKRQSLLLIDADNNEYKKDFALESEGVKNESL